MKKIALLLMVAAVLSALPFVVIADDCDPLLPCGPLPWPLPNLPHLVSPTPYPTMPTPTRIPTLEATMIMGDPILPSPTPWFAPTVFNEPVSTLQDMFNSTPVPFYGFSDEPVNTNGIFLLTKTLWSYIKGLALYDFGVFNPLMVAFFTIFVFVVGFKILMLVFPALMFLFGLLRRVVELILDFIPG